MRCAVLAREVLALVFCLFPPNPPLGGAALRGARSAPLTLVFLSERFLFFLPQRGFVSPTGNLLSADVHKSLRQHYDLFGSRKRNEHPGVYRAGSLRPSGASEGAPFQSLLAHPKLFSHGQRRALSRELLAFSFRTRPSSSACTRPVAIRQRSTAKRHARATMAFLRCPAGTLGSSSSLPHCRTAG